MLVQFSPIGKDRGGLIKLRAFRPRLYVTFMTKNTIILNENEAILVETALANLAEQLRKDGRRLFAYGSVESIRAILTDLEAIESVIKKLPIKI